MKVSGRVTIGIPTINRSEMAYRAIRSALLQTYQDIEVIVSDDASTDNTLEHVNRINDPRLMVFPQQKRLGLVGNFDFCLRHASGEFFLLLGDDDMLLPRAIEELVERFLRPPRGLKPDSIGLVWCPCRITDAAGVQLWTTDAGPDVESPASMLAALFAGRRGSRLSSILVRTADAIAVGGYQQRYGDICDLGNWGQVSLLHDNVVCIGDPLVQYTNHLGSTTSHSATREWRREMLAVYSDLLASTRARGDLDAERKLKAAKRNMLSGITLTILVQTIGKPGWIRNACREAFRSPGALFTPYMVRRLLKDGWKVLRARRSCRQAVSGGSTQAPESH